MKRAGIIGEGYVLRARRRQQLGLVERPRGVLPFRRKVRTVAGVSKKMSTDARLFLAFSTYEKMRRVVEAFKNVYKLRIAARARETRLHFVAKLILVDLLPKPDCE